MLLLALYGYAFKGRLEPAVAWALALTIAIVTSKVFSTQYLLWPLPFIVLAGGKAAATQNRLWLTSHHALRALICVLTSLTYPVTLWLFMTSHSHYLDWLMGLVTLRNALLLLACGLLLRKPGQMRHHPTAASHGADLPHA